MNDIDIAELRKLAEQATPGPWAARVDETATVRDARDNQLAMYTHINTVTGGRRSADQVAVNCKLAASMNPAVIITLIDRLERAESIKQQAKGELRKVGIRYGDDTNTGFFHCFGSVSSPDSTSGESVAIVEYLDGRVDCVMPGNVTFLDIEE